MRGINRRLALCALAACCGTALGQPVQVGTLGVFALLGDSVQVAVGQQGTGSRLDQTLRESLAFKGIGFDLIALKAVSEYMKRVQPEAKLQQFQAPTGLSLEQQRTIAAGAEQARLPGWMVDAIEGHRLTHLLILTRTRGPVNARSLENSGLGRADVDGIGFYLDRLYQMQNVNTGAVSVGLIAPYVQIKLTLMDATSGELLAQYDVRQAYAHASETTQMQNDPWTYMSAEEKVRALRTMVEEGITSGVARIVKPR